jgi:GLPGLI family protein
MLKRKLFMRRLGQLFFCFYSFVHLHAQDQNLFVKYFKYTKANNTKDFYEQWYTKNEVIIRAMTVYDVDEITVQENGKFIKTRDTIRYKREFDKFRNGLFQEGNKSQPILVREHNSNVVKKIKPLNNTTYFIYDTLAQLQGWKITNELDNILNYSCQKAIIDYKGRQYAAWFTTQLPFTGGPNNFRNLPGMILKVEDSNKDISYTAVHIEMPYKKELIPDIRITGKVISQLEFEKIIEKTNLETMKKMYNMMNNGN